LALLLIDLALVCFIFWERFSTIGYFEPQCNAVPLDVFPTAFFECQVRFEVSHKFSAGYSATINIKVEDRSGVVWQNVFELKSPGTLVETKYDSKWVTLTPGTYGVSVSSSAPNGSTEIVAERMGIMTPFGQLFLFGLFPGLILAGLMCLTYADDPRGFVPSVKKDFLSDWKTSLKNSTIVIGSWLFLVLLLTMGLAFFRSIMGIIAAVLVLSVIGLAIEGVKTAWRWVSGKVTAKGRS